MLGGKGVHVPPGFATTADAYWRYLEANGLKAKIAAELEDLTAGRATLAEVGQSLRKAFLRGEWPAETAAAITAAYRELCKRSGKPDADVAVRSSATAEDLPDASFAGQQETFLNIRGEASLLDACRHCFASLFTDRAISYRIAKNFDHTKVALSIGVQRMVRSDIGGSGVMFSIDTETGLRQGHHHQCGVGTGRERRPGRRRSRRIRRVQAAPFGIPPSARSSRSAVAKRRSR